MQQIRKFLAILIAVLSDILQIIFAETIWVGTIIEIITFPILVWLLKTNEIDWVFLPEAIPYLNILPLSTIAVLDVIYAKSKFRKTFSFLTKQTEKAIELFRK